MNSEQLQDFLTDVASIVASSDQVFQRGEDAEIVKKFLTRTSPNTLLCIQYVNNNYTDVDLVQPLVAQILALFYKRGILRHYALQYVPPFIATYLLAISKKQCKSVSIFETFFLAVYNEEILAGGPGNDSLTKRIEEVRIPSIKYRSVYHDPLKLNSLPEIVTMKSGGSPSVQSTVRLGPFESLERFTTEMKMLILTRIMKSVNSGICYLSSDAVSRHVCLCTLSVCHSGFNFTESKLRSRVLENEVSSEVLDDYSRRPRQQVFPSLMLELLTGCYLALYNGAPDLALRAIDVLHQRAQYEMFSEVLLVTNSIRNFLLETRLSKERRSELMWTKDVRREKPALRKECVTNASLRIRKMPEDIPILPDPKEKEKSKMDGIVDDIHEGMDHLKKKMSQLTIHKKRHNHHNKKENGHGNQIAGDLVEELELSTISEDKQEDANLSSFVIERPQSIEGQQLAPTHLNERFHVTATSMNGGEDSSSESDDEKKREHRGSKKRSKSVDRSADGHRTGRRVSEHGSFAIHGFRHVDSGSGTERSTEGHY